MVAFTDSCQVSCVDNEDDDNGREAEDSTEECVSSSSSEWEEECGAVVSAEDVAKSKPSFGNITVSNSSDVHFGSKTFYQGPVTIKQIVYSKNGQNGALNGDDGSVLRDDRLMLDCANIGEEKINKGFVNSEEDKGVVCARNGRVVFQPQSLAILKFNYLKGFNIHFTDVDGVTLDEDFLLDYILLHENPLIVIKSGNAFFDFCHKWIGGLSRQQTVLTGVLGIFFLLSLVILSAVFTVKHFEFNNSQNNDSFTDSNGTNSIRIISRLEWVAQPPVQPPNELDLPVPYVIIWHTATENCSDQATCVLHVRTIQTFHIDSRGWWDIAYNFLVGGDGNAYEGRGWTKEGSHTFDYNKRSIGIAFIGTFISIKPPERQLNACKILINMGVEKGYISKDYKLLAAKQLIGTQAPGEVLYEEIKTWPHWSALP